MMTGSLREVFLGLKLELEPITCTTHLLGVGRLRCRNAIRPAPSQLAASPTTFALEFPVPQILAFLTLSKSKSNKVVCLFVLAELCCI